MENALNHHIGNDIVAFPQQCNTSKYQNQRWLDKVFTKSEQVFILNAIEPEQTLWWFWSCKESAYKVFIKIEKIRKFNPKEIEIKAMNAALKQTTIQYKSWLVWTQSFLHISYIHTIASNVFNILPKVKYQVFQYNNCLKQEGSILVKNALLEHLKVVYKINKSITLIKDEYNIPYCIIDNQFNMEVSFSDDAFFFSFCYYFQQ